MSPALLWPLIVQLETAMRHVVTHSLAKIDPIRAAAAAPSSYYYPREVGTS
jgi:hypothetical protein